MSVNPEQISDFRIPDVSKKWNPNILLSVQPGNLSEGPDDLKKGADEAEVMDLNPTRRYLYEIGQTPLLTPPQEIQLALVIETGQEARNKLTEVPIQKRKELQNQIREGELARMRLIQSNLRLVVSIAKKYLGRGLPFLDMIQEGNIGLMRAIDKYDYRRGYRLSTYATWWIWKGITHAINNQVPFIRVPGDMLQAIGKVAHIEDALQQENDHSPTTDEIAERLQVDPVEVEKINKAVLHTFSLDAPVGRESVATFKDSIKDPDNPDPLELATRMLLRSAINGVLDELPKNEGRVLRLRFGLDDGRDRTLEEIAREIGVTRERIRQIEVKALSKLRHPSRKEKLRDYFE